MGSTVVLRARVEARLARRLQRWAERHGVTVSEAVRIAVQRLLDDERSGQRAPDAGLENLRQASLAGLEREWDNPSDEHWNDA